MGNIELTQGKTALIDDEDEDMVSRFKWHSAKCGRNFYAMAQVPQSGKRGEEISLHRLIMGFPKNYVDHINGNGLDCRKKNLRVVTRSQNGMNRRVHANSQSGFKGVCFRKDGRENPYQSRIQIIWKTKFIGNFKTAIEAAKAYNAASIKHHGEFGRRNIID